MSDTLRVVLWVTGVALGVAAPGTYAQAAKVAAHQHGDTQALKEFAPK